MGTLTLSEIDVRPLVTGLVLITGKYELKRTAAGSGPSWGRYTSIRVRARTDGRSFTTTPPRTSISFHQNIFSLILCQGIEILPAMDNRRCINFLDAFQDPGFQFVQGFNSDMAQKTPRHFSEQGLDDVQP